jgi:hypothetical protein
MQIKNSNRGVKTSISINVNEKDRQKSEIGLKTSIFIDVNEKDR